MGIPQAVLLTVVAAFLIEDGPDFSQVKVGELRMLRPFSCCLFGYASCRAARDK
jgi:hypothetical protein